MGLAPRTGDNSMINRRLIMSRILDRFLGSSAKAPHGSTRAAASRRRRVNVAVESLEGRILQAGDLFGVGTDWRVYELALDAAGHGVGSWNPTSAAGQILSNVSQSIDLSGKLHLFGVGSDGRVYEQDLDATGRALTAWSATGDGLIVSSVSVAADGRHLFGVGSDWLVYEQDLDSGGHAVGPWTATSSTGQIVGNVTVDGSHLFAMGTDGAVYEQDLDASGKAATPWFPTAPGTIAGNISMSMDGLHLFAGGTDGRIYEQDLDASFHSMGVWNPTSSDGLIDSSVTVVNHHLFGVGRDGRVYEQDLDPGYHALNAWHATTTAGTIVSDVSAYGPHLFGVGGDGRVYEQDLDPVSYNAIGNWYPTTTSGQIVGNVSVGTPGVSATFGTTAYGNRLDEPTAAAVYRGVSGTLFGPNGPTYLDVQQHRLGDCWFLASLAEVAARAPQIITSMFTCTGTMTVCGSTVGTYSVRFYDNNHVAHYVTVDGTLPEGGGYYDAPVGGPGAINGSPSPVLWVALAEKAYAKANAYGLIAGGNPALNAYSVMNIGDPAVALRAITGKTASNSLRDPGAILSAWNAGQFVVLCTDTNPSSFIVKDHCYALVAYNPSSSLPFLIFNPWGTDANDWAPGYAHSISGRFWANALMIYQEFTGQSLTTGAIDVNGPVAPTDGLGVVSDEAGSASPDPRPLSGMGVRHRAVRAARAEQRPGSLVRSPLEESMPTALAGG
jgi:hypothetical protein